ncbi:MAG: hypothetical protein ACKV2O_23175 [Acidimicrobiales bacterium]
MTEYVAPMADLAFVLQHIVDDQELASFDAIAHADLPTVIGILEECSRFMAEVVRPFDRASDTVGTRRYVDACWTSVPFPTQYHGGAFPWVVGVATQEMLTQTAWLRGRTGVAATPV